MARQVTMGRLSMDNPKAFEELNLEQQLVVIKEVASLFKQTGDLIIGDQLADMIEVVTLPELINMGNITGEA
jgi:hypothetical protein